MDRIVIGGATHRAGFHKDVGCAQSSATATLDPREMANPHYTWVGEQHCYCYALTFCKHAEAEVKGLYISRNSELFHLLHFAPLSVLQARSSFIESYTTA
jgi:hypothetical protein